jgi:hypothetical protein
VNGNFYITGHYSVRAPTTTSILLAKWHGNALKVPPAMHCMVVPSVDGQTTEFSPGGGVLQLGQGLRMNGGTSAA